MPARRASTTTTAVQTTTPAATATASPTVASPVGADAAGASAVEIAAHLRLSATRLARQLRQEASTGLTPTQLAALATVERHGPLTARGLAERERVAPPSISRVVAVLEAEGLLTRTTDPTDRRASLLTVSPAGRSLLGASRRRKTAWLAARVESLAPDQRARLAAALDILDALVDEPECEPGLDHDAAPPGNP